MVTLSTGALPSAAAPVAKAFAKGSDQARGDPRRVTLLTRLRVDSRNASSSLKNSVEATKMPVTEANIRKSAAGNPIQRCHFRQDTCVIVAAPFFSEAQSLIVGSSGF